MMIYLIFFFSSRRRHTRSLRDWSSDVCSSDLSVSLTRQLAMLRSVLGPSANSAATAAVIAASGMWFRSASMGLSFPRPAERSEERRVGKRGELGGHRNINKKHQYTKYDAK